MRGGGDGEEVTMGSAVRGSGEYHRRLMEPFVASVWLQIHTTQGHYVFFPSNKTVSLTTKTWV